MSTSKSKYDHLILFDGECPFCNLAVRHIIAIDFNHRFIFSPLNGEKSYEILGKNYESFVKMDTLILVENYQKKPSLSIRSKAILRIYWIIGRAWKYIGLFSFFPAWIGDILYRLFAVSRYQFKIKLPEGCISKKRLIP